MKKYCFYFMTSCFPHGKLRLLLLPLKLTVILSVLTTFNALALDLGITNTPAINAQQQKVTGKVLDAATNEPLIGVNVAVEGTTVGTITDVKELILLFFRVQLKPWYLLTLVMLLKKCNFRDKQPLMLN